MIVNGLPNAETICRMFTGQPAARISEGDKAFFLEGMGKISMLEPGGSVSAHDKTMLKANAIIKLTKALREAENAHNSVINIIENTFRDATGSDVIARKNHYINEENRNFLTIVKNLNSIHENEVSLIDRM